MPIDRQGNERCDGYRKEDYVKCLRCEGSGFLNTKAVCPQCGGHGEYVKGLNKDTKMMQLLKWNKILK